MTRPENVEPVAQTPVASYQVNAASEAQSLADWTFDECLDTPDDAGLSSDQGSDLSPSYSESNVFDQPEELYDGQTAFADDNVSHHSSEPAISVQPTPDATINASKTVADLVFTSDAAAAPAIEVRAGAIKDVTASWDFDPPTPDVVSDEIDRRIDEALALAEQMNAFDQPEFGATKGSSGLDLDDLDLPAFLRTNSETKSI
jgi:hypothetical protein